jgi:hypothetical protein
MQRVWIFQPNPTRFRISEFLATDPLLFTWLANRGADRMKVGDQVFIWRAIAGGDADDSGIVAETEIIEPVAFRPDDPDSSRFWTNPAEATVPAPRVMLRTRRIATKKEMLPRKWLLDDPVLNNLTILKMANATNYEVPEAHATRLNALWLNTGRDWSYGDSVAGLWVYHRLYGSPISRLPAQPVAETALLIGRAVPGVYNKVMNFRHLDPRDTREGLSGGGEMDRRVWSAFYDAAAGEIRVNDLDAEFKRLWPDEGQGDAMDEARARAASFEQTVVHLATLSLPDLLARYGSVSSKNGRKPASRRSTTQEFVREPLVVAIAKVRGQHRCEVVACVHPPFEDALGHPYSEVHHIVPLGDGGKDVPENVACLCPAHHREVHFGRKANKLRAQLASLRTTNGTKGDAA